MKYPFGAAAFGAAAFLASCFALATSAQADTISIDRDEAQYSSTRGAEFKVLSYSGTYAALGSGVQVSGGLFQTFCLEADTSISANTSYSYTLGTGATNGGVSGGNPDALDSRTAYLFTKFWQGSLSNYTYTLGSGRTASATALQLAMWNIEGELVGALQTEYDNNSQAQSWVSEANTAVASGGSWFGQGIGNVLVINPTSVTGGDVQSMLVLTAVPVPPAAFLGFGLMAGLGCVGLLRRRSRQSLV